MTHHCHALGCTLRSPSSLLLCPRHWSLVPRTLREAVLAHHDEASVTYVLAVHRAIAAVAVREGVLTIEQTAAKENAFCRRLGLQPL